MDDRPPWGGWDGFRRMEVSGGLKVPCLAPWQDAPGSSTPLTVPASTGELFQTLVGLGSAWRACQAAPCPKEGPQSVGGEAQEASF